MLKTIAEFIWSHALAVIAATITFFATFLVTSTTEVLSAPFSLVSFNVILIVALFIFSIAMIPAAVCCAIIERGNAFPSIKKYALAGLLTGLITSSILAYHSIHGPHVNLNEDWGQLILWEQMKSIIRFTIAGLAGGAAFGWLRQKFWS